MNKSAISRDKLYINTTLNMNQIFVFNVKKVIYVLICSAFAIMRSPVISVVGFYVSDSDLSSDFFLATIVDISFSSLFISLLRTSFLM